ncbi:MAG: hypothetical protein JWP94_2673 [Mucilaginibacter sp.]|nr:hypothetical protein [Mucilaginibacter sp.]
MGMDFQGRKCKVFLTFFLDYIDFLQGLHRLHHDYTDFFCWIYTDCIMDYTDFRF